MWLFFINNHNMTANSVEKHCFVVFNVELQVKIGFKTLYWLSELLHVAFHFETTTNTAYFARNFCLP